jgi:hypothetical protein
VQAPVHPTFQGGSGVGSRSKETLNALPFAYNLWLYAKVIILMNFERFLPNFKLLVPGCIDADQIDNGSYERACRDLSKYMPGNYNHGSQNF